MSTETTNKKIKIDNGTTFGKTYTDKVIDERLQGLVSTATFTPVKEKANNSLQKPSGLTKTKLVGVGTNGQENIEIGDNLTLANGKLSATGGGSGGGQIGVITVGKWYTFDEWQSILEKGLISVGNSYAVNGGENIYTLPYVTEDPSSGILQINELIGGMEFSETEDKIRIAGTLKTFDIYPTRFYNHFITMTDSSSNVALYLTIQNTDETQLTSVDLASYLVAKKVLANGNLHGVVPTYIAGEGGVIKIYYMTPGDSNINPTPDEYQDLSSFNISDLVSLVE